MAAERAGGLAGEGGIGEELAEAIRDCTLELYFQPVVSLADRSSITLEALPRWPHPRRGVLAPPDFIGVAEEQGLMAELEHWAIEQALSQLRVWSGGVASELSVTINLSEEHAYSSDLAAEVESAAEERGVSPRRLGIEVSERALAEAGGRSVAKLRALAGIGVGLTVDDYDGVIESERLRELRASCLKISRRIVAGIPDDSGSLEAARAAVSQGRELGLAIVANGVESPGQAAVLRDLGCEYGQGFLYSVPMPASVVEERMLPR
jgi:EAL domain-containing protein (putative c-di-GMP-specific phosphodiesterase class I)